MSDRPNSSADHNVYWGAPDVLRLGGWGEDICPVVGRRRRKGRKTYHNVDPSCRQTARWGMTAGGVGKPAVMDEQRPGL